MKNKGKLLAFPAVGWLVIFFLVPLILVLTYSFYQTGNYGEIIKEFTFENIQRAFEPLYLSIFWETIIVAFWTTLFALLIGYPYAYATTMVSEKWKKILLLLVTIPFWINFLVRSYAWIVILRSQGLVNTMLLNMGLIDQPLNLLYNKPAVILGMVYALLPFMVMPIFSSIDQLDKRKLEAAYDLGATPFRAFLHVTLPMTLQGIISGCALVFVSSMGMFVVSDIMGGSKVALIGNVIQNQFLGARNWPFGAALSFIIILFAVMLIVLYYVVTKPKKVHGGELQE